MNQQLAPDYKQMRMLARQREIADRTTDIMAISIRDGIDRVLQARFGHGTQAAPRLLRQTVVSRNVAQIVFLDTNTIGRHKLNDILSEAGTCDAIRTHIHLDVKPFKRMPDGTFRAGFIIAYTDLSRLAAAGPALASGRDFSTADWHANFDLDRMPAGELMFPIGKTDKGDWFESLVTILHLFIIGESGSGKSTFLKAMLYALARRESPERFKVAIISSKQSEFATFANLPHLWRNDKWDGRIATEAGEADELITELRAEFKRRDTEFFMAGVNGLDAYRAKTGKSYPRILLMADEVMDLALQAVQRDRSRFMGHLAALLSIGRSHGFHIVIGMTKPDFNILPTNIERNIGNRIAFRLVSGELAGRFGCDGAHFIPKAEKGHGIANIEGVVRHFQGYLVGDDASAPSAAPGLVHDPVHSEPAARAPRLSPDEAEIVIHAYERNGGAFSIGKLYRAFGPKWSHSAIDKLAQRLEADRLLIPAGGNRGRRVTDELYTLAVQRRIQRVEGTASVRTWMTPEVA